MPLTWLLTLAWNESCTSRGISHYMITAQIVLGRYKALPLWVLLMIFYSLENCKCAWEESVSVTNGNIKGEEKLQDFTDLLKFHVPMHQRLCLLSERCCFYHCTQHCILWDEFCQLSIELLIYKTCQVSKGIGMQLVIKDVSAFKCTTPRAPFLAVPSVSRDWVWFWAGEPFSNSTVLAKWLHTVLNVVICKANPFQYQSVL